MSVPLVWQGPCAYCICALQSTLGSPGNEFLSWTHCCDLTAFHQKIFHEVVNSGCWSFTSEDLVTLLSMLKAGGFRNCLWNFLEHLFAQDMGIKRQEELRWGTVPALKRNLEIRKPVCFWWIRICIRKNLFFLWFTVAPKSCVFCAVNMSEIASGLEDCFSKISFSIFVVNIKWLFEVEIRIFICYVLKYVLFDTTENWYI